MQPSVVFVGVAPHPPIVIPEIGGERLAEAAATVNGLEKVMHRLVASNPDSVLIISPHAPLDPRSFSAYSGPRLRGDFWEFGAPQVEFDLPNNIVLLSKIASLCGERGIPIWLIHAGKKLDHGTMVPLYYLLKAGWRSSVVVVGLSLLGAEEHIRFGETIADAAKELGLRLAICASGDMSHRLKPGAPAGYSRRAHLYDEEIVDAIKRAQFDRILNIDPKLREEAGEDIYSSLLIAYGAIRQKLHRHEVYSYEGPFGVGYMTAILADYSSRTEAEGDSSGSERAVAQPSDKPVGGSAGAALTASDLPALARRSVEFYLKEGRILPTPEGVSGELAARAGVFVSIKTRRGELRGCIGTILPTRATIAEEVIHNAVAAATQDCRFDAVRMEEMDDLVFSVDVLSVPELVESVDELDPKRYGLIVESESGRRGLLLPDLTGIDTVEKQIYHTMQKAGLRPGTPVKYYRFTVERYKESKK